MSTTSDAVEAAVKQLETEVGDEAIRAFYKHGPFHSYHEGFAVMEEERDELWDEIKAQHQDPRKIFEEAIQLAAMALRIAAFAIDKAKGESQ